MFAAFDWSHFMALGTDPFFSLPGTGECCIGRITLVLAEASKALLGKQVRRSPMLDRNQDPRCELIWYYGKRNFGRFLAVSGGSSK